MKVLLVSLFMPHPAAPHAGGRYVFELLRHLSGEHRVTLATRYQADEELLLADLRPYCHRLHSSPYPAVARRGLLGKLRLVGSYLAFSRFVDRLIAEGDYDLVQVEWVETALLIRRHKVPMLLDAHDVLTKPFRRRAAAGGIGARLLAALVQRVELAIMGRFDRIITLSDFDNDFLRSIWPAAPAVTVPIPAGLDFRGRDWVRQPATILFLASYRYRPVNVEAALWFARKVLPLVRASVPEARFIVAGDGPPPALLALNDEPGIEVVGYVKDLERCHKTAALFVAPILTGGGIIVKLLDALAAGTPTVSTTFGNEGVGAMPGRDLLVADGPEEFAAAVIRLLSDRALAEEVGGNGRLYVTQRYGRGAVLARLDDLYRAFEPAGGRQ